MARYFTSQTEFRSTYGDLTDAEFVDTLYTNVLGRPGDASGKAFWINRLANGTERAIVTLQFSQSVEFKRITHTS